MPGDPKECRAHALRCEKFARSATTAEARQHFLDLAETWTKLAAEVQAAQRFLNAMEAIGAQPVQAH